MGRSFVAAGFVFGAGDGSGVLCGGVFGGS